MKLACLISRSGVCSRLVAVGKRTGAKPHRAALARCIVPLPGLSQPPQQLPPPASMALSLGSRRARSNHRNLPAAARPARLPSSASSRSPSRNVCQSVARQRRSLEYVAVIPANSANCSSSGGGGGGRLEMYDISENWSIGIATSLPVSDAVIHSFVHRAQGPREPF